MAKKLESSPQEIISDYKETDEDETGFFVSSLISDFSLMDPNSRRCIEFVVYFGFCDELEEVKYFLYPDSKDTEDEIFQAIDNFILKRFGNQKN